MWHRLFATPIITPILRLISLVSLSLFGWRVVGRIPAGVRKCIVIGGPHTSNWDFPIFLMTAFVLRLDAQWMGKHTLFRFPYGTLMRWLGGIPVDRTSRHDMVSQMVRHVQASTSIVLGLSPEGTRKATSHWHTGFWHIAQASGVPIYVAYIDYRARECGVWGELPTTYDVNRDMEWVKRFYANFRGKNEKNFST